jgi:hypothetical protein
MAGILPAKDSAMDLNTYAAIRSDVIAIRAAVRRTVGWVLFVVGLAILGVALAFAFSAQAFIHKATETQGRVTALNPVTDKEDGSVTFAPVFTYTAADGQTYTIASSTSSNPPGYAVGQNVRVLYDPQNPAHASLKGVASVWLVPLIVAPIGFVFFAIGGVLLMFDLRYRRRLASAAMQWPPTWVR